MGDDADLGSSLADLAALVSGSMQLDDLLTAVAGYAMDAIPNADGVGVTLFKLDHHDHLVDVLASSAAFVRACDDAQHSVAKEGPCLTAVVELATVVSGALETDHRWPRFGAYAAALGVRSVLALPLIVAGRPIGAITAYAHGADAFDQRAVALGGLFATPAAVAVHNAHVLGEARTKAAQLQTAMINRSIIDQAIGIVRARSGGTSDEAFTRLRAISQAENVKLSVVAQRIVDEAVRRAQARRAETAGHDG